MSSIPARIPIGAQRANQLADRDPVHNARSARADASAFGSMLAHRIANQRAESSHATARREESGRMEAERAETDAMALDPRADATMVSDARFARGHHDHAKEASETGESLTGAAADADARVTDDVAAQGENADTTQAHGADDVGASGEAASASPVPPNAPYRGLDGVVPELRERLQRVMDRMREEHGVEVSVVETYRPQARQDALHAQGRSTPGQVVTWTRNSRHTQGRAVDVVVNGGYTDRRAFVTLQQVARDEGLHTLGMRDPGHLELPSDVAGGTHSGRSRVDLAALTRLASEAGARVDEVDIAPSRQEVAHVTHPGQVARPARVAQVAAVASVATVATVARVATVGARPSTRVAGAGDYTSNAPASAVDARGATTVDASGGSASPNTAAGTTVASNAAASAGGQGYAGDSTTDQRGYRQRQGDDAASSTATIGTREHGENTLALGNDGGRDTGTRQAPTRAAAVTGGNAADSIARMDRIDLLRDGSAARPLSQLTLSLDNAAGGTDRIRVGLRGNQVDAVLELSDSALHDRVTSRLGELQGALEQRGLETDSLRVRRAGATATDGLELSRIASAAVERGNARGAAHNGSNPGGDHQQPGQYTSQRGRDERAHRDTPTHDHQDRHNPRREPKENQR